MFRGRIRTANGGSEEPPPTPSPADAAAPNRSVSSRLTVARLSRAAHPPSHRQVLTLTTRVGVRALVSNVGEDLRFHADLHPHSRAGRWRSSEVASLAVEHLADQVEVAGVPGGLLEHVQQDPAQRGRPDRVQHGAAGYLESVRGDDGVGAGALVVVL